MLIVAHKPADKQALPIGRQREMPHVTSNISTADNATRCRLKLQDAARSQGHINRFVIVRNDAERGGTDRQRNAFHDLHGIRIDHHQCCIWSTKTSPSH